MNKAILIGNLGKEPEKNTITTSNGELSVVKFSMATTETTKQTNKTEWHRIVVFGRLADNCYKYLNKGSKVALEGPIRTKSYTDKNNNQRYYTEIVANSVEFLDTKPKDNKEPETETSYDDYPF